MSTCGTGRRALRACPGGTPLVCLLGLAVIACSSWADTAATPKGFSLERSFAASTDALLLAAVDEPSRANTTSMDELLDEVLSAHVARDGVNYPRIASDERFVKYLNRLESQPVALNSPQAELAYWINAYNALAIKGILDGKSPSTFFGRIGYFKLTKYKVAGEDISLYDLERKVLIPLGEPRIHFAIVCASASCPKLRSEAYSADKLEQQLEADTRTFINDPTRNRFDRDKKVAHVSKIFDWFEEDFQKHSGSVQRYLARYVDDPQLASELEAERYEIRHLQYDWSLNGISPTES